MEFILVAFFDQEMPICAKKVNITSKAYMQVFKIFKEKGLNLNQYEFVAKGKVFTE
jgi:hypothetical protein